MCRRALPDKKTGTLPSSIEPAAYRYVMAAIATLEPISVTVEPGQQATTQVRVRNTGTIVDRFHFEVLGEPSAWSVVTPSELSLFPNAEGTVEVRFTPPRDAATHAGGVPFAVKVTSDEDEAGTVVEEGTLDMRPFRDLHAELVPRTSSGSRKALLRLAVDNRGNSAVTAAVSGADPNQVLDFSFEPPSFTAAPDSATFVKTVVRPKQRFMKGPAQSHPFQVMVDDGAGQPLVVDGTLLQESVIPDWAPRALAGLLGLLVLFLLLWFTLLKPQIKSQAKQAVDNALGTPAAATASKTSGSSGGGGSGGGGGATAAAATPSTASASGGTAAPSIDGRLVVKGNSTAEFAVPGGKTLQVTDIVLENPNGDTGTLSIKRSGAVLLQVNMANFRDLDYHFVSPIIFTAGQRLQVTADGCAAQCTPGAYFSGFLPKS
jgi:hypothetical protein